MLRATNQHVQVLIGGTELIRVSQQYVAVLRDDIPSGVGNVRVSQQFVEVLQTKGHGEVRITGQWVAILAEATPVDAFRKVIEIAGLSNDSQGQEAVLHALLKYADYYASGTEIRPNPVDEIIRRLEVAKVNPHALTFIRQVLNDSWERYARVVR